MQFSAIDLNHIFKCAEIGEITQRVLAIQTLDNLVGLGIIQDQGIIAQINQLRLLTNINRNEFMSRGTYVVRLLTGEYASQVMVGYTDNWDFAYQNIKDTYGCAWLMVFVGISFTEDESTGAEWEDWIRDRFKYTPVPYSDKYYLNENLIRQFAEYITSFVAKEQINVTLSVSPMLMLSPKEFNQQVKQGKPQQQQPYQPQPQFLPQQQPPPYVPIQQPLQQPYVPSYNPQQQGQNIRATQPMPQYNPNQPQQGGYNNWQPQQQQPPPNYNPYGGNQGKQNRPPQQQQAPPPYAPPYNGNPSVPPYNGNPQWPNQFGNPPKPQEEDEGFIKKLFRSPFGK